MAKKEDIEAIREMVNAILDNCKLIMQKENGLQLETGTVSAKSGNVYTVKINDKTFSIKSQLSFSIGAVVGVLTNSKTNIKYLLG